jgi:hypothetical protein
MDNKSVGILLLIGLGLFGFLLLSSKKSTQVSANCYQCGEPLRLMPAGSLSRQYTNEEVWDIDWSEDGLPKKVTIHRNAREF